MISGDANGGNLAMDDVERLVTLINSGSTCILICTHEEDDALDVVRWAATDLRRDLLLWSLSYGVRDGLVQDSPAEAETATPEGGLCQLGCAEGKPVCVTLDLAHHLKQGATLRLLRDTIRRIQKNDGVLIMIDHEGKLPEVIRSYTLPFELTLPTAGEIEALVKRTLRRIHRKKPIEVGITRRGMNAIVRNLRGLTRRQAQQLIQEAVADDRRFDDEDVNVILAGKRRVMQGDGLLEYIQTPLDLDQIGGMKNLKRWLRQRKNALAPEARDFGIDAPRGVLMLGVQGAGKSLCAKAIATAWQQPLLRMDCGALYNSYIGESERNLRQALKQAECMAPVILWIDEIEKAFASAASQSSDGGLSKRMFATLLTWMQDHEAPVFLAATANDIEALPPELLRKGRFDEIFFVGLPGKAARRKILEIHLDKRGRDPSQFRLDELTAASQGFSGAEIEQAVVSALHEAYTSGRELDSDMILAALQTSPPISVVMAEKIDALYRWAEGRCVPAD
jgi:AAA+ superfamily predicted ATPase